MYSIDCIWWTNSSHLLFAWVSRKLTWICSRSLELTLWCFGNQSETCKRDLLSKNNVCLDITRLGGKLPSVSRNIIFQFKLIFCKGSMFVLFKSNLKNYKQKKRIKKSAETSQKWQSWHSSAVCRKTQFPSRSHRSPNHFTPDSPIIMLES